MLKGIDPAISAPLLAALMEMGHGDEIVFADANFPAVSHGQRIIFCRGLSLIPLLEGVLKLFPLDYAVEYSGILMRPPSEGQGEPPIWEEFRTLLRKEAHGDKPLLPIPKADFYARSKAAFAVAATGERRTFSNIMLRKGIITAD
jgi:L-fucose mutarotase